MSYYRIIDVIGPLSITSATGVKTKNYRIIEPVYTSTRTKTFAGLSVGHSYNSIIDLCNCSESVIEPRFYNSIISIISGATS